MDGQRSHGSQPQRASPILRFPDTSGLNLNSELKYLSLDPVFPWVSSRFRRFSIPSSILWYRPPPKPPPDRLHPTLSSWLKKMNKLDNLINRLQELASSAPPEHRPQLLNKVMALRTTFKRQQERFIAFLQLSEEYADKYLQDISTEVQQQRTVLDNLEKRLEAANKLHGEAADLQIFYESRTVANMNDLRVTAIPQPLPQDDALFCEVDLVLAEIRRFYEELNKFWTEEICHVVEALKKGRTEPRDLERWKIFHSSLKQTIESWKAGPPDGDAETPLARSNGASYSTTRGVDLRATASSLSLTFVSLGESLERMSSSASLQYSQLGRPSFQRVYVAFLGNRDLCLSFLWDCVGYGEKVFAWCQFSIRSPSSSRTGATRDFLERTTRLRSEATDVSAENAASAQGSRRFKIAYNKALTLVQKTTSGSNTLLEILLSWATVTDGPSDDALPDIVTLDHLREVKFAWEKARDSVHAALATLTGEPAQQVHTQSGYMRWMKSLARFL